MRKHRSFLFFVFASWSFSPLAALACIAELLFFTSPNFAQQPLQQLHNHVRPAVSSGEAKLVGPLPAGQEMHLSIVLPLRNQEELTSLLGRLYDPSSPDYRHFLTVEQFTEQFGPTADDYQAVVDFAKVNGFAVTDTPANRRLVSIRGSVGQINNAFHVKMNVYQHPTENRTFFSPDREPSLNLSVPVSYIAGLDNYSIPRPAYSVVGSAPAGGTYMSSDMRAAYYTSTLPDGATPLTGQGQIVGLFAISGYDIDDVNMYFSTAGQTNNVPIVNVLLDDASGIPPSGGSSLEFEIDLDIEQVLGMAPGLTQLRVYEGNVFEDILNTMASENIAKQLSTSVTWAPDSAGTSDDVFMEFAAQGQSFFSASGDEGAYPNGIAYPAEDTWVTAVGGTELYTNGAAGPWLSEAAWSGSGGGPSPDGFAIPSYQAELNGVNGASKTLRNVPDVAMDATNIYFCSSGSCGQTGGTSASTPLWAGFMALVNQQAAAAGEPPLGLLNPYLYAIGEGSNYDSDFHDITSGNNDCCGVSSFYSAGTGYDLVTGWGSPNGQNLINDLAPLTGPKAPGFTLTASPGYLTVYAGASGTDTITVNDWGGFTGNVTLSVSGLPSGVTASWSKNPTTGTSVLKLTASSAANTNTADPTLLTITGTSGAITASVYINLAISPEPTNPPEGYVTSGVNFAAENIGSTSAPQTLTFTFSAAATLGSVTVLTQGVTGLDFANASTGNCAVNTAYIANNTCTVGVTFAPKFAGTRYGAVVLTDSTGNVIASAYLQGTGLGPQINFLPNTESTVASQSLGGLLNPGGVAVDGSGNVYIADTGNNRILKETWSSGNYIQSIIPTSSLLSPGGIAVDGAGNIYIADSDHQRLLKETPTTGGNTESVIASFPIYTGTFVSSVAVDGNGNVYFSAGATLYEAALSQGSYTQSIIPTAGVNYISGVAVDGSGNVYISDSSDNIVLKLSAGSYTQSTVPISSPATPNPLAVAVDGMGNVYIPYDYVLNNILYSAVLKETLLSGSYTQSTITTGPLDGVQELAVDGSGNVYIANTGWFSVLKEDFADPPSLTFATTTVNSTSNNSPITVKVENIGNQSLILTGLSYPVDFPEAGGDVYACTSTTTLNSTLTCDLPVDFTPRNFGVLNENLQLTDNALNVPGAKQNIVLNGTGTPLGTVANPTFSPVQGTYISAQSVTISDTTVGASIYYTTDGVTTPTSSSTKYTGAITVPVTETIQAIALAAGYSSSAVVSATYTITPPAATPTFSPAQGTYTSAQSVTISDATSGATIYYTTDGVTTPTSSSTKYTRAITVPVTETIQAIALAAGYSSSTVASATYTITPPAATPNFSPAQGTYTSTQSVTISDTTVGASIYYTTDGVTTPTSSSTKYTGAITVPVTETIQALALASGYSSSAVASATYTINLPAATPNFSPAQGTYTSTQSVTISDTTPNAAIYYTTDGVTTPTSSSTKYNGSITVSATETIHAIALASNYSSSAVASATYTINLPTPDFSYPSSPAPITVTAGQSGTTTISITPANGFDSSVSFSCTSGLPAGASCSFSPPTVTPPGTTSTMLTVSTLTTTAKLHRDSNPFLPVSALAAVLFCFGFRKRRRLQMLLLLVVSVAGFSLLSGCGGGASASGGGGGGSQPVTTTITVTATSGSLSHNTTFLLTVN